jgi:hypothetical protein
LLTIGFTLWKRVLDFSKKVQKSKTGYGRGMTGYADVARQVERCPAPGRLPSPKEPAAAAAAAAGPNEKHRRRPGGKPLNVN